MASVNRVTLLGNLGRDVEVRYMPNGDAVANLSLATTESWKDKSSGEKQEKTEWHRVTMYKRLAEIAGEYLKKGSQIYIEGRLETRKWTDKEGKERYTTEIIAHEMKMLGAPGGQRNDPPQRGESTKPASQPTHPAMDDDIPFANPYRGRACLVI